MRPVPNYTGHTISNAIETIKGRIDEQHTTHIMHQLSAVYSKPVDAVVREYATNARDSHIEAGKADQPIEVTLPTERHPKLRIRDFGVGLDRDELREVYLSYGASSKRETDEQTGSLGFGSKAAVAYAPLGWDVTAVKAGRRVLATVAKDEFGVPEMSILFDGPTTQADGVTIEVPVDVDDIDEFHTAAAHLFRFWPKGTVLVDGEQPDTIWDDTRVTWLDESVALLPRQSDSYIVMGNVPYRLNRTSAWGHSIVAFVEMGAVAFTPSREELNFVHRTEVLVEELVTYVNERALDGIVERISAEPTPWDRLAAYYATDLSYTHHALSEELRRRLVPVLPRQVKDYPSGPRWEYVGDERTWVDGPDRPVYVYNPGQDRNNVSRAHRVNPATFGLERSSSYNNYSYTRLVVTDFPYRPKNLSPHHRYHLREWANDNGGSYRTKVVVLPGPISEIEFLEGWSGTVATWEEVKAATPRPKSERGSGRAKTRYDFVQNEESGTVIEDGIEADTVLYTTSKNPAYWSRRHPGAFVVSITDRQVPKFLRLYPDAKAVHVHDTERQAIIEAALTDDDHLALSVDSSWAWLDGVHAEDPDLAKVLAAANATRSERQLEAARLGVTIKYPTIFEELTHRYPLLPTLEYAYDYSYRNGSPRLDHIELYVNAVWRELEYERLANTGNIENVDTDVVDADTTS